jgi:argininosuccinate lyase
MWKGRFGEDTAEVVLKFSQSLDIDWCLAVYDIAGSIAHARMLQKINVLTQEEMQLIVDGLLRIRDDIRNGDFEPSIELEDVHMNIEKRLIDELGPVGAKLHTGRSRNDQIATTMRLYMRDRLLSLGRSMLLLLESLMDRAEKHGKVIIPGYTHLQQAQPINMGHYWMSHFFAFARDCRKLVLALESLDESPLGAGALAGSTIPLDRDFSARAMGFGRVTDNSLDTVANRDYLLDYHYFSSVFAIHCSRLAEDLIIYSSQEFGWIILPDAFCTGSSMMPQKKNPDVLELVRGKTGQIIGHLLDLMISLKGLPLTYDRDLQEDKRGLLSSLNTVTGILEVLAPLIARVEVDEERALAGLEKGMALATDVAEYLVLKGIPFREAHWKVGQLVKWCLQNGKSLQNLSLDEWKKNIPEVEEDILPIMNLESSVSRRQTYGGTSFANLKTQLAKGMEHVEYLKKELEDRKVILFQE